jgi:hypothetical protein
MRGTMGGHAFLIILSRDGVTIDVFGWITGFIGLSDTQTRDRTSQTTITHGLVS